MTNKKQVEKIFNERMAAAIQKRRKNTQHPERGSYLGYNCQAFAPLGGYELLYCTNKPSDLLFIKEQCAADFCAFVVATTWNNGETGFICFDITEDKKEISAADLIGATFSNWGKDARKYARETGAPIYAVLNKNICNYWQAMEKHQERAKKPLFDKVSRFNYTDQDRRAFDSAFKVTEYGASYNELSAIQFDNLSADYVTINGKKYTHNAKTRKELYNCLIDASGYPVAVYRLELKERADRARLEKAQAKARKDAEEWEKADKSEAQSNLLFFRDYFKDECEKLFKHSMKKNRFDFYIRQRIADLAELCEDITRDAAKISKRFASFEQVAKRIEDLKELAKKVYLLTEMTKRNEKAAARAYAFSWWELNDSGELINTYKDNGAKYFAKIFVKNGIVCGQM